MNGRLILAIMLCFLPYCANANISIKALLDSAYIIMGKQTTMHVEILENISTNGVLPINDEHVDLLTPKIEIINRRIIDTIDIKNDRRQIKLDFIIQSFDSGLYAIPPILYIVNNDTFKSNELALKVIPVPVDSMATINGQASIISPNIKWYDYLPDFITDNWGLFIIAIVIVIGIIIYFTTRKKEVIIPLIPRKKPIPPFELAMKQLMLLKEERLCDKGQEKEFYTRLTDILRIYIDTRFGINAMEMTSSQIIESLNRNEDTKEPNKYMKKILEIADFVKFAKVRPIPDDNAKSFNWATQFVIDTKPKDIIEQDGIVTEKTKIKVELNK